MSKPEITLTIGEIVTRHAAADPGKTALSVAGRDVTFSEVVNGAQRVASFFTRRGVARGDRVAVWMPNSIEWVLVELAASLAGVAVIAINSRYKSDEVGYMLAHSEAKMIFMVSRHRDTDYFPLLEDITGSLSATGDGAVASERLPALRQIILCDTAGAAAPAPFASFGTCLSEALSDVAISGDTESILNVIYTSGTTSVPKGVLLSERALVPHSEAVATWFGVGADDVVMLLTPFCGIYGLDALLMTLSIGARGIIVPDFDPEQTLDLIEGNKITFIGGTVDTVVRRWAEVQAKRPRDISSIYGSTIPVGWMQGEPVAEMPAVENALGVKLAHVYGLSETNAMVIVGDPADAPARRHPVAGKAIWPGIEVKITDPENGADKPAGEIGEIRLRGPVLFSGYLKNPDATRAAFDEEEWFHTGDLGSSDPDGYISYIGRLKDIVKVSGFTVAPAEIEQFLRQHPDVSDVQVVGYTLNGMEALGAAIVTRVGASLSENDVIAFCNGRIANFKKPARAIFIERFPVKSSANSDKVDRAALRALFEAT